MRGISNSMGGRPRNASSRGSRWCSSASAGSPPRLIFDNALAVGRKVAGEVRLTELLQRFQAHYGFAVTLCNPYSGYEKGHVENKVGYLRRHLLVPRPTVADLSAYNHALLARCEADWGRSHYKKHTPMATLVRDDQAALGPLPRVRFDPVRYVTVQTDGDRQIRVGRRALLLDGAGICPPDGDRAGRGVHGGRAPPAVWEPANGQCRPADPAHPARPEPRGLGQQRRA